MANWTITPNTASIDSNGRATFPKNKTTNPQIYTIKYEDNDGCTASTEYTIPTGCSCSEFTWDSTTSKTIGSDGGTVSISHTVGWVTPTIKWYNSSTSTSEITKPSWVTNVSSTNTTTTLTIENNSGSERTTYPAFIVSGSECKRYSLTQSEYVPPTAVTVNPTLTLHTRINNEFINTLYVQYYIINISTGEQVFNGSTDYVTKSCSDAVVMYEETIHKNTIELPGTYSDYKVRFHITNCHGWTMDGTCTPTSSQPHEYQWTLPSGSAWTTNQDHEVNLSIINGNSWDITLNARKKQ